MLKHSHSYVAQNPVSGFQQRADPLKWPYRLPFPVAVIHEKGLAAGAMPGFHIAPTVAHHEAGAEVDIPRLRGREQQPGLRLAALAARVVVVRAHAYVVELQKAAQSGVDLAHFSRVRGTARDIG